jgi:hypothetical protein
MTDAPTRVIQIRRGTAAAWAAKNPTLAIGEPALETDTGKQKMGDGTTPWATLPYLLDSVGSGTAPSPIWMLKQWTLTQAFQVVSASRDSNSAITTASVVWPDGAPGTLTTDTASTAFPGSIDAFHVTYVYGSPTTTRTITQPAVTRDANGAVSAQPALTVA